MLILWIYSLYVNVYFSHAIQHSPSCIRIICSTSKCTIDILPNTFVVLLSTSKCTIDIQIELKNVLTFLSNR